MIDWTGYTLLKSGRYFPAAFISAPQNEDAIDGEDGWRAILAYHLLGLKQAETVPYPDQYLPEMEIADAKRWTEIPLVVQGAKGPRIFPVLLGSLKTREIRLEPGPWLKAESKQAVWDALLENGSPDGGFALIRRTAAPEGGIEGRSLTLPLAIGAHYLKKGKKYPTNIVATGFLGFGNAVESVGYVANKSEYARKFMKGSVFIFPYANKAEVDTGSAEKVFPVRNLQEALEICDKFTEMP